MKVKERRQKNGPMGIGMVKGKGTAQTMALRLEHSGGRERL